jgi:hypothetical protein
MPRVPVAASVPLLLFATLLMPEAGPAHPEAPGQRVSIEARPAITRAAVPVTLIGEVERRRAGETVTIQAKDCGQPSYTEVKGATTSADGVWRTEYWPGVNTTLRAVWDNNISTTITLGQQAWVELQRLASGRFYVGVHGKRPVWRKHVLIQQRRSGAWKTIRTVVLTEQIALGQTGAVATYATFKPTVPRGTMIRAILPRSQARPCYLAGASESRRA